MRNQPIQVFGALLLALSAAFSAPARAAISVVHSFSGLDGSAVLSELTLGADGSLYGVANLGGTFGYGTVFKVAPDGTLATLHHFTDGGDGGYPRGRLVQDAQGNLYGTTTDSNGLPNGTVFKITPAGQLTTLHAFNRADGACPTFGVTLGRDGNLYGTTSAGGPSADFGVVFRLTPAGAYSILYAFTGGTDGGYPEASVVQATDGNFYGTTPAFGADGWGTLFRISADGTFTLLHAFTGGTDGASPTGTLIQATDGFLYGMSGGGAFGQGNIFRSTLQGSIKDLHDFTGQQAGGDGSAPQGSLLQANDGAFYGVTIFGGANNSGTLFRFSPSAGFSMLESFVGPNGGFPDSGPIQGPGGILYGATWGGGDSDMGVVYKIPQRATTLAARAEILQIDPTSVHLRMKAILTASNPAQPVAGRKVTFSTPKGVELCVAFTDATGTAACGNVTTFVRNVVNLGYVATFAGDPLFAPATASGALIQ